MSNKTIGLSMIVKNEADILGRCLQSVHNVFDDIVVVDTGSTDDTVKIAKSFGARIFEFPWIDDFSAARNHSLDQLSTDWFMWLDADDIVQGKKGIRQMVDEASDTLMAYHLPYLSLPHTYWRERLLRNNRTFRWDGPAHEVLITDTVVHIMQDHRTFVQHAPLASKQIDPNRNLRILEKEFAASPHGEMDVRRTFYLAREYYDHNRLQNAARTFRWYVSRETWADQKYMALIHIAHIFQLMRDRKVIWDYQETQAEDVCFEAMKLLPTWPEAYIELAEIAYYKMEWANCLHWINVANSLPQPQTFVIRNEHRVNDDWIIWQQAALWNLGRREEALKSAEYGLSRDPSDAQYQQNFELFRGAAGPSEAPGSLGQMQEQPSPPQSPK